MGSLEVRPVHSTGDLRRFIELPFRLYRDEPNWVAPLRFERQQFLDRRKNPFFEHGRGRVVPRPARRARRSGASPRRSTTTSSASRTTAGAGSASSSARTTRRPRRALLDAAEAWLRGAGLRPHGRADGLHDERRVRRADRGPRAHAADPLAVDPPLLPGAAARAPGWPRRWTCSCGSWRSPTASKMQPGHLRSWPTQVEPRHGVTRAAVPQARPRGARSTASWRSTTRPGRRTGASCRYDEGGPRHYASELKPSSTRTGSWSPREDGETVGGALTLPDYQPGAARR